MREVPGARDPRVSVPTKRPERSVDLMELSGLGQIPATLEQALEYRDRAHYVHVAKASKQLTKLRVRKLELGNGIPPWIGELHHLRTLQVYSGVRTLPASLFTLPHLTGLHLDHTQLESVDGIEQMSALDALTCGDTPLVKPEGALEALAKKLGAQTMFGMGLEWERKPPPPPKTKAKIIAAINADTLADRSNLRKLDLSGATLEHAYITHDLRGANLAGTTWLHCDFEGARLAGADLTGATFYDCYFDSDDDGNLDRVKASGATFVGCGGQLELKGAQLRDAKLLDLDPDIGLDLTGAKAPGVVLEASFISEREHMFYAKGANLRGARVRFDVCRDRRKELGKRSPRWKKTHLAGAKTDKTTVVEYVA